MIPSTLSKPGAAMFWLAIVVTGVGAGTSAAALTRLLEATQRALWAGNGRDLLASASHASPARHVAILAGAGLATGFGQLVLRRLSSGNGIDITEAISFHGGRLPALRTACSAVLSVFLVAMGVSLGREGAPKQIGAVVANACSDAGRLSDDERKLLVACGAGAGMAAAYGVPLGGALFALEVLRGALALRLILPALVASLVATAASWVILPDAPTYVVADAPSSWTMLPWAILAGPIFGLASVALVRLIQRADRHKPTGRWRLVAPVVALALLGVISIPLPQLLGNGKDMAQLAFDGRLALPMLALLFVAKPLVTAMSLGSGAPGGLFTPTLSIGAMLGGALGVAWTTLVPSAAHAPYAWLGAGAMLAATTQGPISAVVLLWELTGRDRFFALPLLLVVATATLVARTIEPRSIYDAKLSDAHVAERQAKREALTI